MKFLLALCAFVVLASAPLMSQMKKGDNYLGARVGIGARDGAFAFSLDFENCFMAAREFGPGQVVLGGSIDMSFPSAEKSALLSGNTIKYTQRTTFVPISAHVSYHFGPMMDDKRVDPFFLVGLAYRYINVSNTYPDQYSALNLDQNYNDFTLVGAAGVRYSLDEKWALSARVGFGMTSYCIGASMKL